MPPIRVGGIGFGLSLKVFHIPYVDENPDFHLHAILQRSPPKTKDDDSHVSVARPDVKWYQSEDEFFADENIDLVIVGTPSDTHLPLAKRALESGKHVIVEKPFVPTSTDADILIRLAKEKGKILTVFQNRRYDNDFLTLQRLISESSNPLGYILDFESNFDRYRPGPVKVNWKSSGPGTGQIYDLGAHLIDQALVLFGEPQTVQGILTNQRREDKDAVDDAFTVILTYDDQRRVVTLKATTFSCFISQPRYRVRGFNGSYVKFGEDPQELQRKVSVPPMELSNEQFGVEKPQFSGILTTKEEYPGGKKDESAGLWETKIVSEKGNYMGFYKNVAEAIQSKGELNVKPEQARNVIKLIELAKQSSEEAKVLKWT